MYVEIRDLYVGTDDMFVLVACLSLYELIVNVLSCLCDCVD